MSKTLQIWSLKQIFLQFTYIKTEPEVFNGSVDTLLTNVNLEMLKTKWKEMKEFLGYSEYIYVFCYFTWEPNH